MAKAKKKTANNMATTSVIKATTKTAKNTAKELFMDPVSRQNTTEGIGLTIKWKEKVRIP
jgi:hypothetical protein